MTSIEMCYPYRGTISAAALYFKFVLARTVLYEDLEDGSIGQGPGVDP